MLVVAISLRTRALQCCSGSIFPPRGTQAHTRARVDDLGLPVHLVGQRPRLPSVLRAHSSWSSVFDFLVAEDLM
jgi:hypothetical protein